MAVKTFRNVELEWAKPAEEAVRRLDAAKDVLADLRECSALVVGATEHGAWPRSSTAIPMTEERREIVAMWLRDVVREKEEMAKAAIMAAFDFSEAES